MRWRQRRPSRCEAAIAGQPRVKIDTPRLHGSIALTGARFDDLTLAKYHETVDPKSPEVVLLSPPGTANPYLAEFGWVAAEPGAVKVPGPDTVWKASDGALTPSNPVTLTWDNGQGLVFTRTISVDPDYMFTVHDEVHNTGSAPVKLLPYGLISRTGTPQVAGYYILFEGLIGYLDGSLQEVKYSSLSAGQADRLHLDRRLARLYRQILADLADPGAERAGQGALYAHASRTASTAIRPIISGPRSPWRRMRRIRSTTRFFAGAKEVDLLDGYAASGIPRFDRAIDFGWFYFLTKPIFLILQFFDRLLGNFGLAILLLTLCVKLLFFPLANKSYQAMSKMKLLQPEIAETARALSATTRRASSRR